MGKRTPTAGKSLRSEKQLSFVSRGRIRGVKSKGSGVLKRMRAAGCVKKVVAHSNAPPAAIQAADIASFEPSGFRQPVLETARLVLRPFSSGDAPKVAELAGRREIADTTTSIPHPYSERCARDWIQGVLQGRREGKEAVFAVVTKTGKELVGAAGLRDINPEHKQAELGFWIGVDWWRQGFATESAQALLQFGFEILKLNRIYARHMLRNPASGRVLKRIGMNLEGVLRDAVCKWGTYEDVALLAIIRHDWLERGKSTA